jgi:hypothetical protein
MRAHHESADGLVVIVSMTEWLHALVRTVFGCLQVEYSRMEQRREEQDIFLRVYIFLID